MGAIPVTSEFRPASEEHELRVLAQLADGSLEEHRRAAVEAYVATSRDAQIRLAQQRRVVTALRSGGPVLSARAQAELDALLRSSRPGRRAPVRPAFASVFGLAIAVLAVVVMLRLGSRGPQPRAPTITQMAHLVQRSSAQAPPRSDPTHPRLLAVSFGGIALPDYGPQFGIRTTGQRRDALSGRRLLTVYYRLPGGTQMSYSVVSGRPVAVPVRTESVTYRGVRIDGYLDSGLSIVTLVRNGHTCVLAGPTALVRLIFLAEAPLRSV